MTAIVVLTALDAAADPPAPGVLGQGSLLEVRCGGTTGQARTDCEWAFARALAKRDPDRVVVSPDRTVTGIDPAVVDAIVHGLLPEINVCYQLALQKVPSGPGGEIEASFRAGPDGQLASVVTLPSTPRMASFTDCVRAGLIAGRVPGAGTTTFTATYTFALK